VVRTHTGIEVFKQDQVLFVGDPSDSFLKLLEEDIHDLWRRAEGGGIGAEDVSGTRGSVEE
jgi:hypothetical protein